MLIVNNLSKAYGTQTLFDGASFFTARRGSARARGADKRDGATTLFRMILGKRRSDGEIHIPRGYTIRHLSPSTSLSAKGPSSPRRASTFP